jgi:hypothetical protein
MLILKSNYSKLTVKPWIFFGVTATYILLTYEDL